ncbi:glycosyltransferase [Candidatus Chloroploca sp. Khr17]|uniref:glycosyltransferase n=1 Tax=Candidatus Chloroploca sp. Khr17 TaxID=2496869 RepID=UPI00101C01A9|nr:glycosyltransferase [Candidatus Chloroploca sp. Khr17]
MDRHDSVSVIVIVKNGERFLAQALQSILDQTLPPAEILVVDGNSTDRTAEIAQSFADVRYLRQPDSGISNAYNFGIAQAQGELIAFLSHDDLWTPDKLAIQVNHLLAHLDCQYTVCRIRSFLEPGETPPTGFRYELLQKEPVAYIMETLLVRRSLFEQVGLYDPHMPIGEDVDWYARVFDAKIVGHVCDQVLVHKRVHGCNTSLTDVTTNDQLLLSLRRSVQRKHGS